jgi:hemolysin activation/secretion protein
MRPKKTHLLRQLLVWTIFVAGAVDQAQAQEGLRAPAPSQVTPPRLPTEPRPAPQIPTVSPPEAPAFPKDAEKLSLVLLGFDIEGEFEEFVATRRELEAPLVGKRVTVAQIFEFANKLQEAYVGAGYLLVRVVVVPQELGETARVKIRVIDGFIERIDVSALPTAVRNRIAAVLEPLFQKHRLTQNELERRLLLAGDTPGLELRSTFAPGEQIGGSVLILTGVHRPVSASAYIDNAMPVTFGTLQTLPFLGSTAFSARVNRSPYRPPDTLGAILQPSFPRAAFYKARLFSPSELTDGKCWLRVPTGERPHVSISWRKRRAFSDKIRMCLPMTPSRNATPN